MHKSIIGILFLLFTITACSVPEVKDAESFISAVEESHKLEKWKGKEVIEGDIVNKVGAGFKAHFYQNNSATKVKFELENEATAVFDGKQAWVSPNLDSFERARFHLLTWPYFLSLPYKLRDEGVKHEYLGKLPFLDPENPQHALKITFNDGVGDSPDDWYILYWDENRGRLAGMAYIVTYTKSKKEAEKNPHALVFDKYKNFSAIPVSTEWQFYNWSKKKGIEGESIGQVNLRNVDFNYLSEISFSKPKNAKLAPLP